MKIKVKSISAFLMLILFLSSCSDRSTSSNQSSLNTDNNVINSSINTIISPPKLVEASSYSQNEITVHWLPAQIEQGDAISNYEIYISNDRYVSFGNMKPKVIVDGEILKADIKDLSSDTLYYVAIVANTKQGHKRISNILSVKTLSESNIIKENIPNVVYLEYEDIIWLDENKILIEEKVEQNNLIIIKDKDNLKYYLYLAKDVHIEENRKYLISLDKDVKLSDYFENMTFSISTKMVDLPDNNYISTQSTSNNAVTKAFKWDDEFAMSNTLYGMKKEKGQISSLSVQNNEKLCYEGRKGLYKISFCIPQNLKVGETIEVPIYAELIKDHLFEFDDDKDGKIGIKCEQLEGEYKILYKEFTVLRDHWDYTCKLEAGTKLSPTKIEIKIKNPDEKIMKESKHTVPHISSNNILVWKPKNSDEIVTYLVDLAIEVDFFGKERETINIENVRFSSENVGSIFNQLSELEDGINFKMDYKFDPEIDIYFNKKDKYAKILISANPYIKVLLSGNIEKDIKKLIGPYPVFSKRFVRVIPTAVPIVIDSKFTLMATAEIETITNFKGILEANPDIYLKYEIEFKDGQILNNKEATVKANLVAKSTGKEVAILTLHIYPSVEVSIYDIIGAHAVLDPYIKGRIDFEAEALHEQGIEFHYDSSYFYDYESQTYFDYWFNDLSIDYGIDAYIYAGAEFLFIRKSYPEDAKLASKDLLLGIASFSKEDHRVYLKKYYFDILGCDDIIVCDEFISEIYQSLKDDNSYYIDNLHKNYTGYKKFELIYGNIYKLSPLNLKLITDTIPPRGIDSRAIQIQNPNNIDLHFSLEENIKDIIIDDEGNYWIIPDIDSYIDSISLRAKTKSIFRQKQDLFYSFSYNNTEIPTYWIKRYNIIDVNSDDDSDGFSNIEEFRVGTDPTDNLSAPYPYIFDVYHNGKPADIITYIENSQPLTLGVISVIPHKFKDSVSLSIISPDGDIITECQDINNEDEQIKKDCNLIFKPDKDGYYTISLNSYIDKNYYQDKKTIFINIKEADEEAPVITLKGDKILYIALGNIYEEPGYTAVDNQDGDITHKVIIEGQINTLQEGEYKLIYKVKDSSGNIATAERTIIVKEKKNNPPQIINITPNLQITYGDKVLLNVSAYDPDGENLIITWKQGDKILKVCYSSTCSVSVMPEQDTTYTVYIEDMQGSFILKSVEIKTKPPEYELLLNANLSETDIALLDGETKSITLNVSTTSKNISNLRCYYEYNGEEKNISCNGSATISIGKVNQGNNTVIVFAIGISEDGKEVKRTKTISFTVNIKEKLYNLTFLNETYPDNTKVNISDNLQTIDKQWTLKMSDTHSATLILEKDTSKTCNLTVNGSLPTISVSPSETFDVNIKFDMPTSTGVYQCYFKVKDTNGNYYKIGNSDNIWIKVEVIANDLVAFINTNTKEATVNTPINLIVNIQGGNPPYELTVNWGDNTTADTRTFTDKGDYFLSHTYTSEGNYTIEGYIVDKAGKTYSTTINVKVSSQVNMTTSWTGKLTKVKDVPIEIITDITATQKTTQEGYTYYEYSLNIIPDTAIYYKGFILPVPQNVLNLNDGNIKFTFVMQSGEIKYYDREMWISTDTRKIGIIPIDVEYYNEVQSQEGYGKVIIKDFTANTSQTLYKNILNDSYGANAVSRYSIELTNDSFTVYRYENSTEKKLFTEYTPMGNYITEINLNFRGNGKVILAVVEYDTDKDGTYDKKVILNTKDKVVDWSSLISNTQNNKPVINSFTADKTTANVGDTITFSYDVSDQDGDTLTCEFDFDGDGNIDKTVNDCSTGSVSYAYQTEGSYTIKLRVYDTVSEVSSVVEIKILTSGGEMITYIEDFSSNPDFTSLAPDFAYWDAKNENYYVKTKDDLQHKYWAYSPDFGGYIDIYRPFTIQVDILFENQDWGTYPGVRFYGKLPVEINDSTNPTLLRIDNAYRNSYVKQIGIYDENGHEYYTPQIENNKWYRVTIKYKGDGKADIKVIDIESNSIIYNEANVVFQVKTPFRYLGVGYYNEPDYGNEFSPIRIDNIKIEGYRVKTNVANEEGKLVAYYSFDNCDARDDSGNGNNGTINGTPECVNGINGNAFKFGGYYDPDYIEVPNSSLLSFIDNFSFVFWFNIQDVYGMDGWGNANEFGKQTMIAKSGDREGLGISVYQDINNPGTFKLVIYNGRCCSSDGKSLSAYSKDEISNIRLNEWHMVAVVADDTYIRIYVDGILKAIESLESFNINPLMSQSPLRIGIDEWALWYPFNGIIDEIKIYNRALTEEEIADLFLQN